MGLLVAGTKYRGEFEERLKKLMDEIKQNDDIILVGAVMLLGAAAACWLVRQLQSVCMCCLTSCGGILHPLSWLTLGC